MQQSDCSLSGERREAGEEVSFSNSDHVLSLLPVALAGARLLLSKIGNPWRGEPRAGPGWPGRDESFRIGSQLRTEADWRTVDRGRLPNRILMRPLDKETFKHPSILLPWNIVNMYISYLMVVKWCMKTTGLLFYLNHNVFYHGNFCDLFVISVRAALCEIMVTRLRRIHQIGHCQKYYFSAQSQKI